MYQYALVSCGVHNVLTYHCCCPNIGSCVRVNKETGHCGTSGGHWMYWTTQQLSTKICESWHRIRRMPLLRPSCWKCRYSFDSFILCTQHCGKLSGECWTLLNTQHWDRWCQLLGGIWLSTSRLKNYSEAVVQRGRRRWGRVWSLDQCRVFVHEATWGRGKTHANLAQLIWIILTKFMNILSKQVCLTLGWSSVVFALCLLKENNSLLLP